MPDRVKAWKIAELLSDPLKEDTTQMRSIRNDLVYIENITTPRETRERGLENKRRIWYDDLPCPMHGAHPYKIDQWKHKVMGLPSQLAFTAQDRIEEMKLQVDRERKVAQMFDDMNDESRKERTRVVLIRWLLTDAVSVLMTWRYHMGLVEQRMQGFQTALRGARLLSKLRIVLKEWFWAGEAGAVMVWRARKVAEKQEECRKQVYAEKNQGRHLRAMAFAKAFWKTASVLDSAGAAKGSLSVSEVIKLKRRAMDQLQTVNFRSELPPALRRCSKDQLMADDIDVGFNHRIADFTGWLLKNSHANFAMFDGDGEGTLSEDEMFNAVQRWLEQGEESEDHKAADTAAAKLANGPIRKSIQDLRTTRRWVQLGEMCLGRLEVSSSKFQQVSNQHAMHINVVRAVEGQVEVVNQLVRLARVMLYAKRLTLKSTSHWNSVNCDGLQGMTAQDTDGAGVPQGMQGVSKARPPGRLSAAQLSQLRALFKSYDKDQDGSLSYDELYNATRIGSHPVHGISAEKVKQAISQLDSNNDGR